MRREDATRKALLTSLNEANGDCSKRGWENTATDMTLGIVGISEMKKYALKYDI
jgi:hypothetical protein